jgi:hypothetical protein
MRTAFLLFPMFALTLMPLGGGCGGDDDLVGAGGGTAKACERESDCDDGNGCTYDFCISGLCDHSNVSSGTDPDAEQIDGDCLVLACDDGESVTEPANDPPDDPNDDDCVVPICLDGSADMGPRDAGEFCSQGDGPGVCDGAGTCSCTPPSPQTTVFVDPIDGTDDASHGGAWGSCAYRTLDYALQHAEGTIVVPNMVFTSAEVTFPIVLTTRQRLRCAYDDNEGTFTVFSGSGAYSGGTAAIAFEGARNRLERCGVDAGGASVAIVVASVAENDNQPHEVTDGDVTGAAEHGIRVDGSRLYLGGNDIHGNAGIGVGFTGGDPSAYLENNTFSQNGTDVSCSAASPSVNGAGNSLSSCTVCQGCSF